MEGKAELAEEHNKVVRANFTILRDAMTEGRLTLLNAAVGDEFAVASLDLLWLSSSAAFIIAKTSTPNFKGSPKREPLS